MLHVLLVSDHSSEREEFQSFLTEDDGEENISPTAVDSLAHALDSLRTQENKWDCVVFDLDLPDAYGLPLIVQIREEAPDACQVMLAEERVLADIFSSGNLRTMTHMGRDEYMLRKEGLDGATLRSTVRQGVFYSRSDDAPSSVRECQQLIVNELEMPLCRCDGELRILMANRRFSVLFEREVSQLAGISLHDLIDSDIGMVFGFSSIEQLNAVPFLETEWRRTRKDGTVQWISWKIRKIRPSGADDCVFQISGLDVTVQKERTMRLYRVESELALALEDAEQARMRVKTQTDRMITLAEQYSMERDRAEAAVRVKSDFLATMSHEIRTPMTGVLGMTDLLQETSLTEEQQRFVLVLQESGEVLLAIINDILDLAKMEAGKMSIESVPCDPKEITETVVRLLRPKAEEKNIVLSHVIEGAWPPAIMTDPVRLRQILFNLVGNAIKFTERGSVCVRQFRVQEDERDLLRFEVIDTGIGIEKNFANRLFTRFSQADASIGRRYGGTGLGLAICKQLVSLMGGDIGVVSETGQGSTFWFAIPCVESDQIIEAKGLSGKVTKAHAARSLRMLVAEDNEVNQFLIQAMLGRLGHSLTIVDTGRQAVNAVLNGTFDLVLMDVLMPDMGGIEATKAIRSLPGSVAAIPIIGVTADVTSGHLSDYLDAGMNDCVAKPIQREKLLEAIDRCMGEPIHTFDCEMQTTMGIDDDENEETDTAEDQARKMAVGEFMKRVNDMIATLRTAGDVSREKDS